MLNRFVAAVLISAALAAPALAQDRRVPTSAAELRLSYAPIVQRAQPAVVNVYAAKVVQNRNPLLDDPIFRRFFGVPGNQQPEQMQRSLDLPSRFSKPALKCCLSRTVPAHPARISQRKLKCDSPRADGCAASWWLKVADPLIWTSRHWLWREQLASPMCRRNCAPVISQFAFQWYFARRAKAGLREALNK